SARRRAGRGRRAPAAAHGRKNGDRPGRHLHAVELVARKWPPVSGQPHSQDETGRGCDGSTFVRLPLHRHPGQGSVATASRNPLSGTAGWWVHGTALTRTISMAGPRSTIF